MKYMHAVLSVIKKHTGFSMGMCGNPMIFVTWIGQRA